MGQEQEHRSKKRKRDESDRHQNATGESRSAGNIWIPLDNQPHQAYASLYPQLRYILHEVVRSKWKCIPENTENKIGELFHQLRGQSLLEMWETSRNWRTESYSFNSRKVSGIREKLWPIHNKNYAEIEKNANKTSSSHAVPTKTREVHFDFERLRNNENIRSCSRVLS